MCDWFSKKMIASVVFINHVQISERRKNRSTSSSTSEKIMSTNHESTLSNFQHEIKWKQVKQKLYETAEIIRVKFKEVSKLAVN